MLFLHFIADEYEWGFRVPSHYIPTIGDTVNLWHGLPDEESDDAVDALIVTREFDFASDFNDDETEIWFTVELKENMPEGHIPDSTEWPSKEWTKRKEYAKKVAVFVEDTTMQESRPRRRDND